jgi:hypothetical protein
MAGILPTLFSPGRGKDDYISESEITKPEFSPPRGEGEVGECLEIFTISYRHETCKKGLSS